MSLEEFIITAYCLIDKEVQKITLPLRTRGYGCKTIVKGSLGATRSLLYPMGRFKDVAHILANKMRLCPASPDVRKTKDIVFLTSDLEKFSALIS